ncbi:MAG: hypothetical protein ACO1RT_06085 [Planctomycetaceae bacterium]
MSTSALKAMERSVINPFDASRILVDEKGVFADDAKLVRGSFLFRVIDFEQPFKGRLVYDGWWFWQRVTIDGLRVWSQISWLRIERAIHFRLPAELDSQSRECRIDIQFGPGLRIRRFQVTVAGITAYDEIS